MRAGRMGAGLRFLGQVWRLTAPYWNSEERWRARLLLTIIVLMTLGQVFINVRFNDWNRRFYEGLQNKDAASFVPLIVEFSILAVIYILVAVYRLYFRQMLEMRWRVWLTRRTVSAWLDGRAYYRLELQDRRTDNPDQRIAEDLRLFTSNTLGLSLGLLGSLVTLVSFAAILWSISGSLTFDLAGGTIVVPGYMIWVALAYAIVGSIFTHVVGRRLIPLNFEQQQREADFRFGLIRLRENAEGVALYGGEGPERNDLLGRFERIRSNWWGIMNYTKRLTFYVTGYDQIAILFPFLVASPRYFAGEITLGVLAQTADAFGRVQGTLSWFVENYGALATWKATVDRLLTFQSAIDRLHAEAQRPAGLRVVQDGTGGLRAHDIDLLLPSGRPLLTGANLAVETGERLLISGPTGTGKSTLFRAIAGLWPFGRGTIEVPSHASRLFLPQRPYLPIGTLREVISFPSPSGTFDDEAIRRVLAATGLSAFVNSLDQAQNWSLQMSVGEQQRLAIARALLQRPDWLFLDEATSAVDAEGERRLYQALLEHLPDTSIVSIAHHEGVAQYHARKIVLARASDERELVTR
jgi:vitamin B12/bleomycin/antimicrobial peptide transport system ATP-binding/permease protein